LFFCLGVQFLAISPDLVLRFGIVDERASLWSQLPDLLAEPGLVLVRLPAPAALAPPQQPVPDQMEYSFFG